MKSDTERLIKLCHNILDGRVGVLEGSRKMGRWRFSVGPENDSDFITFVGIDSETDHLPLGKSREGWNAEALAKKDLEIAECEEFFRERAFKAARNLIEKHNPNKRVQPTPLRGAADA